ncbi:peptidase domain-containing ABC transporter [Heminiphilus faecis]|uniref:Peptidase domain-containing ABC transporter n=2 Tax=Pseudomonadati TaxID=3379134 RepID=A0ABV4CWD0_9BACT
MISGRHFRLIRQRDSMQCGVACLAMVCRHFGVTYSVDELERYCTPTAEGVSLKGIADGAAAVGFDCCAARVGLDDFTDDRLPSILHWNQNHFVVLYRVRRGRYYVADPGKGLVDYSHREFVGQWAANNDNDDPVGIALFLKPQDGFPLVKPSPRPSPHSFRFLAGYLNRHRRSFAVIAATLVIACALQLIMPFLTQSIVDRGINDKDIGFIWLVLAGELMIVAGRTVTDFLRSRLLLHISMKINISLVSDFFMKLLRLPMSFFDTKLMGDLLQRIGDHDRVQSFLTGQVLNIAFTLLSFVIFGTVLFIYDKLIFAVFLVGSLLYGLWITRFLSRRKVLDYELFESQAINRNRTYRFITAMQEIKLQNCEGRRRKEWEDTQLRLFDIQLKGLRLRQTQEAGSIFINEVKNIVITVLAASAVIDGRMTFGAMLAIQYIIGQLNSPVEQLMGFIYSLQDVKISLERINEVHTSREEECRPGLARHFTTDDRSIHFHDVDFKYDRHAPRNTLGNITIDIPAGKVTAIVGASGSGKTTLIKLMLGYYPVAKGEISIARRPIADYNLQWWRSQCCVVMQDGIIFSESIARNIAASDGDIDRERLIHAARIACIHDTVEAMPLRYETIIGPDGTGLSQGQKQRILIARAVYRDPDFIFLDEATNSLDARNEHDIVQNLADFYKGRTVVIVAHRLSTVKDADNIIVLDGGHIAETGTHASLTARKGLYYKLVKNQLELGS